MLDSAATATPLSQQEPSIPHAVSLVVPGLLALPPGTLGACAPLASLAAYAAVEVDDDGIECAALAAAHLRDSPIAPLAALGTGIDVADDGWLCADPVVLVAGHEDVRLVDRVDDLSPEDASALRVRLDRHFADDDLAFQSPRPDRWLLRVRGRMLPATTSLARALDRPLRALLPTGSDAGTWRRWMNEIQMLLHEDPVNESRIAHGRAHVSGLWFWGGGELRGADAVPRLVVADARESDVLRGAARAGAIEAEPLPDSFPLERAVAGDVVFMLPAARDDGALPELARRWLSPAVDALLHGSIGSLTLVADAGVGPAAVWRAAPPSLAARLRARWSRRSFSPPAAIVGAQARRMQVHG